MPCYLFFAMFPFRHNPLINTGPDTRRTTICTCNMPDTTAHSDYITRLYPETQKNAAQGRVLLNEQTVRNYLPVVPDAIFLRSITLATASARPPSEVSL